MKRADFSALLRELYAPGAFQDAAENGLQVEGRDDVQRVVCGVSANLALIEKAIALQADAVVVHHGLVWGGIRRVDGWLKRRLERLLVTDTNLFAFHLPMDAHAALGNNAGLADVLGLVERQPFGTYKGQRIGVAGRLPAPTALGEVVERIHHRIGAPLAVHGDAAGRIDRIAICSGGASDLFHEAVADGAGLYLTGETTEWVKAVADETGVAFVAAGHHATERFGPRALAMHLQSLGLAATFVDVENAA